MSDLVTWVRPLIEARKATAEAAAYRGVADWSARKHPSDTAIVMDGAGEIVVYDEGEPTEEQAAHIALNDPRQILADCEYQLAELADHEGTHRCDWGDYHWPEWPCTPLKRLAAIYRHRNPEGYTTVAGGWEP
jgi:hypothetical protein